MAHTSAKTVHQWLTLHLFPPFDSHTNSKLFVLARCLPCLFINQLHLIMNGVSATT
ncbi:hypothetical protein J2T55_002075 [Methylohalomonas lacus]|uniref:Uncharacterized protein n=1 Tax=Methylohalomonas lacus TaxID=398773 RepID=A0AAE3HMV0_9GAMM|nr:hypothetical protein [Methylohalomonas lacus]